MRDEPNMDTTEYGYTIELGLGGADAPEVVDHLPEIDQGLFDDLEGLFVLRQGHAVVGGQRWFLLFSHKPTELRGYAQKSSRWWRLIDSHYPLPYDGRPAP
jgi:hypothetical protein